MNPLQRTIHVVLETNIPDYPLTLTEAKHKRVYQLVKYVTGKTVSQQTDYNYTPQNPWYGYDTITLLGQRGFLRVALQPLFQEI